MHGWGRSGQHRDSGMQGGHGNAGWKRHRWSSVIRYGWVIGKKGFTPINITPEVAINVKDLGLNLEKLVETGIAKQAGNRIEIDLVQLGFNKLLGDGKITQPLRVIVEKWSERAAEKINRAGGEVVLPEKSEKG